MVSVSAEVSKIPEKTVVKPFKFPHKGQEFGSRDQPRTDSAFQTTETFLLDFAITLKPDPTTVGF